MVSAFSVIDDSEFMFAVTNARKKSTKEAQKNLVRFFFVSKWVGCVPVWHTWRLGEVGLTLSVLSIILQDGK